MIAFAHVADAQELGGANLTFNVSQTLRYTDNSGFDADGDSAFRSQTDLGFGYSSQTRSDDFSISVNSGFILSPNDDVDTGIIEPTVRLNYRRTGKTSEFTVGGSFRSVDLDNFVVGDDENDSDVFVLDGGTRTDINGSVGLVFGEGLPLGGSLSLSQSIRDYSDTSDPDLSDETTTRASGTLFLRFDDRITGRLTSSWTDLDESDDVDGTDRTTITYGAGLDFLVNRTLTTGIDVTYFDIETVEGGVTTQEDGIGLTLTANQTLPNGSLRGRLSTEIEQNGRRDSFSVDRDYELKNGNFGWTFGGSQSEVADFSPIYGLRYNTELVRGGNLGANLSQTYNVDADGDEEINTNLTVSYNQALSRVSNFSTSFSFRDNNVVSGDEADASRWDLSLRYRHNLTRDWGLVGGYTRSFATADDEADRSSNTVFVGIDRSFGWRP